MYHTRRRTKHHVRVHDASERTDAVRLAASWDDLSLAPGLAVAR